MRKLIKLVDSECKKIKNIPRVKRLNYLQIGMMIILSVLIVFLMIALMLLIAIKLILRTFHLLSAM